MKKTIIQTVFACMVLPAVFATAAEKPNILLILADDLGFIYFEHQGNRGLRIGDYKLVSAREDNDTWELYDLGKDRCEQNNLADTQPERVRSMTERWQKLNKQFHQKQ